MAQRLRVLDNIIAKQNRLSSVRKNTRLDAEELKNTLFFEGNYEKYVQPMYDYFNSNKDIYSHHNIQAQNREQLRFEAVKMTLATMKFCKLDLINDPAKLIYSLWATTMLDAGIITKTFLHYFLYIKSIMLFGSNQKHQQFLADALSLKDLGCFGLTEFYHGSYSKELQTLATYQHSTKQFVLTTQGTKGMKYWIGAASELANMSTIWAQLIINGKSYGPHPFILQIRCKKTHRVLPGITIGDCGPKNGLNYIDNGYIILDNVRISRDNLLGKLGSVDEEGNYKTLIQNIDTKFGFHMSPLSGGRGAIAFIVNIAALKAGTVALRYACTRKQFDNPKKNDQILIIDYALTRNRLIPQLAQAFVQIAPGLDLAKRYFLDPDLMTDLKYLGELHAISACVKARMTWNCTSTTENMRSILGGHGFSGYSNFSSFFHDTDINNTWEGDNNVLLQQTSKYLMKTISKKGKTSILNISFLWQPNNFDQSKIQQSLRTLPALDIMMKALLFQKYQNAKKTFEQLSKTIKDKNELWMHFHPQAGNTLSLGYADYFIYSVAQKRISQSQSQLNKQFLQKCLDLWGFCLLQKERFGSKDLRRSLQKEIIQLSDELTEPMIVATDVLIPSTHIIGSVFGNFQGKGFEQYLNLIYSSKDTFTRVPYYEQIVNIKKKK